MKPLYSLTLIMLAASLAACGEADAPPSADAPAPQADPGLTAALTPAPTPLDAAETYRQKVSGRWSERPACMGMTWNFQADGFTTPGEIHCAEVEAAEAAAGAVRVTGRQCMAEGEAQADIVMDVSVATTPDTTPEAITVTGVGNPISTEGWTRCE